MDLFLSILLGALVGLRNEIVYVKKGQGPIGGFRSFIFIAILGYFTGVLLQNSLVYSVLGFLVALFLLMLVLIYYTFDLKRRKSKLGLTMEISAVLVYLASVFLTTHLLPAKIVVAIIIFVAFLLASQRSLRSMLFAFREEEVTQIALFATLTFVILPFLPNKTFSILGIAPWLNVLVNNAILSGTLLKLLNTPILNPFKLWLFVVLVSGIEALGYVLARLLGQVSGVIMTSLVSGFVSSTSSTVAFANQAKTSLNKFLYLGAILLANSISFTDVFMLVIPISFVYFKAVFWPTVILMVVLGILGIIAVVISRKYPDGEILSLSHIRAQENIQENVASYHVNKMFDMKFAIGFAIMLTIVQIITKIAYVLTGSAGFLVTSALAGLAGINAVLINTAELVATGMISMKLAVLTFFAVNIVNLLAKAVYIAMNKQKEIMWGYLVSVVITLGLAILIAL